jgi:hypothetical protein
MTNYNLMCQLINEMNLELDPTELLSFCVVSNFT